MIVLNQKQKRILLILGVVAVLLLAMVAIITAIRLQQVGTEPVAPSVPKSKPRAEEVIPTPGPNSACRKTWTIAAVLTCSDASRFNDDFSTSSLDTTKWTPTTNGGATISISGGQLVISIPQQTSQQFSNVRSQNISGDFVVEVDLVSVQTGDSGSVEMSFLDSGEVKARVSRYKSPSGERVETSFGESTPVSVDLPIGTGSVRARIVREGSTIRTYYRLSEGSVFNLIAETTSGFVGEGMFELFSVTFPPDFPATVARFDNFTIACLTTPTLTPTPTGTITPTVTLTARPPPTATNTPQPTTTPVPGTPGQATNTPVPLAQGPTAIPTVPQQSLPQAGGILPTIGAVVGGLGIILLGLLLLL